MYDRESLCVFSWFYVLFPGNFVTSYNIGWMLSHISFFHLVSGSGITQNMIATFFCIEIRFSFYSVFIYEWMSSCNYAGTCTFSWLLCSSRKYWQFAFEEKIKDASVALLFLSGRGEIPSSWKWALEEPQASNRWYVI